MISRKTLSTLFWKELKPLLEAGLLRAPQALQGLQDKQGVSPFTVRQSQQLQKGQALDCQGRFLPLLAGLLWSACRPRKRPRLSRQPQNPQNQSPPNPKEESFRQGFLFRGFKGLFLSKGFKAPFLPGGFKALFQSGGRFLRAAPLLRTEPANRGSPMNNLCRYCQRFF